MTVPGRTRAFRLLWLVPFLASACSAGVVGEHSSPLSMGVEFRVSPKLNFVKSDAVEVHAAASYARMFNNGGGNLMLLGAEFRHPLTPPAPDKPPVWVGGEALYGLWFPHASNSAWFGGLVGMPLKKTGLGMATLYGGGGATFSGGHGFYFRFGVEFDLKRKP